MEKYWSRFQDTYDDKQEYVVEKSKLIGDRTKALFLIGKKK